MFNQLFNSFFRKKKIKPRHKFIADDNLYWILNSFNYFCTELNDSQYKLFDIDNFIVRTIEDSEMDYVRLILEDVCQIMGVNLIDGYELEIIDNESVTLNLNQDSIIFDEDGFSIGYIDYNFKSNSFKLFIDSIALTNQNLLYSIIAHEVAHVKLNRLSDPILDEYVADLLPYYYGLGIVSINSHNSVVSIDSKKIDLSIGYLPVNERVFILALYSFRFNIDIPLNRISSYLAKELEYSISFLQEHYIELIQINEKINQKWNE